MTENTPEDGTAFDRLREVSHMILDAVPHARVLGLSLETLEPGRVVLRVPYNPKFIGDPETGVIHGGVITTLLDNASAVAVTSAMENYTSTATLDLRIDYMRPGEPGVDIFGEAICYKMTRSIGFVRATAYHETPDDPIATAQASFMLDSNAGRRAGANLQPKSSAKGGAS